MPRDFSWYLSHKHLKNSQISSAEAVKKAASVGGSDTNFDNWRSWATLLLDWDARARRALLIMMRSRRIQRWQDGAAELDVGEAARRSAVLSME